MSARTMFPRPSAETLAVFDEAKVKRGSDGRFDAKGGSGARPRGPGGFRPKKGQLQEDDVPAKSPNGAKIVDFAKGVAKYADGSTLTAEGWRNVPAKNKARGNRFALPTTTAVVAVPEGDEFKTTYHDPKSGRFTSPGRGAQGGDGNPGGPLPRPVLMPGNRGGKQDANGASKTLQRELITGRKPAADYDNRDTSKALIRELSGRAAAKPGPPKMTRREPLPGERAKAGKAANAREKKMEQQFLRPKLKPPVGAKRSGRKPPPIPGR